MRAQAFERRDGRPRPARQPLILLRSSIVFLLTNTGCLSYPDSDERLNDQIIFTHFDETADFKAFMTFSISPDVVVFDENDGDIERELLDDDVASRLVDQTAQHLTDRGYAQVAREEDPDLGVTISVLSGTVTSVYVDYWGGYWGYPYYPYYPSYYTYSYNTGTAVVDAVDLKNAPPAADTGVEPGAGDPGGPAGKLDVIWTGLVYGVLSGSQSQNTQAALDGIDQAFKQSPYFQAQ